MKKLFDIWADLLPEECVRSPLPTHFYLRHDNGYLLFVVDDSEEKCDRLFIFILGKVYQRGLTVGIRREGHFFCADMYLCGGLVESSQWCLHPAIAVLCGYLGVFQAIKKGGSAR